MNHIPEETIQQILASTDIVELISSYFPVKRAGSSFKALCPFHHEKSPSFNITPSRQSYHCFGCGAGGTAIRFLMEYENLDFRTALKKLADRANIPLTTENELDPESRKRLAKRSRILSCLADATRFFQSRLADPKTGITARDYLDNRGIAKSTVTDWQLGYAPQESSELIRWAKDNKYNARDLIDAGLASLSDESNPNSGIYARFRHRLMFPIHNDYGDVVGFSGRILDPNSKLAKYVNSPETSVFEKGKLLYGLHRAKRPILKAGSALLCEGQMDLISCASNGVEHIVAPLGTALTQDHVRLLRRHSDVVVLCYDGDAAGHKASLRSFHELAKAGIIVRIAPLPEGEDPDSFIRQHGREAFLKLIGEARDFFDYLLAARAPEYQEGDLATRTRFTREIASAIAAMSDAISRENVWMRVATRLEIAPNILKAEVEKQIHAHDQQSRNELRYDTKQDHHEQPANAEEDSPLRRAVLHLAATALMDEQSHAILSNADPELWQNAPHANLLNAIRERPCPDGDNPRIQAFLSTLEASLERALQTTMAHRQQNPADAAQHCLDFIRKSNKKADFQAAIAKLRKAGNDPAKALALQKEILDLKRGLQDGHSPLPTHSEPKDPF